MIWPILIFCAGQEFKKIRILQLDRGRFYVMEQTRAADGFWLKGLELK